MKRPDVCITSLTGNMNSTDLILDTEGDHFSWWFKVPMVTYLLTISSFGVPSNIIVAIIYGREPAKSACDWLILTMSITDAFVCFCSPALYIRSCLRIPLSWKASFFCTLEYWLQLTAMFASCLLLAIIALDRYAKICRPGLLSLSPTMARNVCVIIVVISAGVCLAPFFGRIMDSYCYISEIRETAVTKLFFTIIFGCFVVSFFIVTFAYANVCQTISQKVKLKQKLLENNGLNLSAKPDKKQHANSCVLRRLNLWHQICTSFHAKLNMRRRTQNKRETDSQSSNEYLYSNENRTGSGEIRYNNDNLSHVEDYEKTVFQSTDLKIEVSEAEAMLCDRTHKCHSLRETSEAKAHLPVEASLLHHLAAEEYIAQELVTGPDQTTGVENQVVPILHNTGGIKDGVLLHRCDGKEFICTDIVDNKVCISLLPSDTRNDFVDNIHCSSGYGLAGKGLTDFGAKQMTPTPSRKPLLNTDDVDSGKESLNLAWGSKSTQSVGDSNLLYVKRYKKHEYLTMFSDNVNKGDSSVWKQNSGNNNKSKKCRSVCLPPRQSYFYFNIDTLDIARANSVPTLDITSANRVPTLDIARANSVPTLDITRANSVPTIDITRANSHSNLHVTIRADSDAGFWFSASDRVNAKQITRNGKADNDSSGVRLPDKFNLIIPAQSNDELGHVVSRVPFFYKSRTVCFQNPFFTGNMDECSYYSLATHKLHQRLVKSEPYFSLPPSDGHLVTFDRNVVNKTGMPRIASDAQCAFKTTRSPNEECITLPQLPPKSQSSCLIPHLSDPPQKNISDGNQASSVQFPIGSSAITLKDTPSQTVETQNYLETRDTSSVLLSPRAQSVPQQTDETLDRQDYSETTNNSNAPLQRPRTQSALKPTGSTTSRRSNKSSSFADPATVALMADKNFTEDKSEALSCMSLSPFRKSRMGDGCRTSGRSRSSVRSATSSKMRFARERQMTYMLLSVTAAFLLSWIPPWIMYLSCLYGPLECVESSIIHYLATIHLLNYVASPVIYLTFNPTFRSKVSQLFAPLQKCHCCCPKESCQREFSSSPT